MPLLLLLGFAAAGGFAAAMCLYAERLRQAEWRVQRAEAMCNSLRRLSDEYRKRLRGSSPQQVEKKIKEQERKLDMLRFQVGSLSNELKSLEPERPEIVDLTNLRRSPISGTKGRW